MTQERVTTDGKFFRFNGRKFFVKGISYGPFAPNGDGQPFASRDQTARDFEQIRSLGANVVRVYSVPSRSFLDLARQHGLKVFIDVPWEKHRCFLETHEMRAAAREAVRAAAITCQGHSAVFALSIVNEIPPDVVRWHGAEAVSAFLDELVAEVKAVDPGLLCTFASFPPTEFLHPSSIDFVTFNVYLHDRPAFESYLARLQMLANEKPLLLGEFGIDSIRHGEEARSEMLRWHIESAFSCGLAGTILFSFTDDWFRGGQQITDWAFGLTTRERVPKPSFQTVQQAYRTAPYFPLITYPKVSIVVASYNGGTTLRVCLESVSRLNYPNYEVILVDDGSTDDTREIAAAFPQVRTIRQRNRGLSAARNTGIAAAEGDIVAFTDSDCRVDEDWLYYAVGDLLRSTFAAVGGHNFLPPEDSAVAAAVMVSPGGPAHVMLTDREAEHIPGCNMVFYKWALESIQGFDPVFRKAGDDVDVCWRLRERGWKIGFSPAAFVWHYRRSTARAYLRQQAGYGEAEALLAEKHPEYFNALGGGVWHGRIYAAGRAGLLIQRPVIYHGVFGTGFFQKLYAREPAFAVMFCTSLQYHCFVVLPLLVAAASFPGLWPAAIAAIAVSASVCVAASLQADLPAKYRRWWSRPLIALLFFCQPLVRGWARYKHRLEPSRMRAARAADIPAIPLDADTLNFWSRKADRPHVISAVHHRIEQTGWSSRVDSGWDTFDFEIMTSRWAIAHLTSVQEELSEGRKFIRCRIAVRASWSSWLLAILSSLACIVAVAFFREQLPTIWFVFALLPIVGLFIADEQQHQQRQIAGLIQNVAANLELEKFSA